ncbi:MAG: MotA/TolQ/ExbB proton channel family protein [Planctomycetota bacterium]|jgi:biopolymer transport protein ExbB|nr:MotA/TolQ/ExbB proton channel family protein [Planctomycetota bacterium]
MARFIRLALTAVMLNIVCTAITFAAEGGEAAAPAVEGPSTQSGTGGRSLFEMVIASGVVEWVLIVLSIVGVSIGIHRMLTIKRDALVPEGLVDDLHNVFAEGVTDDAVEEALGMVQDDGSMLGEVLAAALDKKDFGFDSMREAAEAVGVAEQNKYMTQISYLSLLAAIGPMLGLLGTVWGMIGAFMKMAANRGNVDPALLADNIGGAMITTATGLIIAIPMMFLFFFLRARVNKCVLDASVYTGEVLDYFRVPR